MQGPICSRRSLSRRQTKEYLSRLLKYPRTTLLVGCIKEGQFNLKHGYNVGQIVELKPNVMRIAAAGPYEIMRLMPEPDVSSESPRYRVKSREEIHKRIVPESDLMLPTGPT
jgi:hypothetical protein